MASVPVFWLENGLRANSGIEARSRGGGESEKEIARKRRRAEKERRSCRLASSDGDGDVDDGSGSGSATAPATAGLLPPVKLVRKEKSRTRLSNQTQREEETFKSILARAFSAAPAMDFLSGPPVSR